jgi:hypothetical protein
MAGGRHGCVGEIAPGWPPLVRQAHLAHCHDLTAGQRTRLMTPQILIRAPTPIRNRTLPGR